MRKLTLLLSIATAIALSSCQSGLKNQIKGKWIHQLDAATGTICNIEFTDSYFLHGCKSEKYPQDDTAPSTTPYEIISGDRIVFTASADKKITSEVKFENGNLMIKNENNTWTTYKKN